MLAVEKRINEQIDGAAAEPLACGCFAMAKEARATKLDLGRGMTMQASRARSPRRAAQARELHLLPAGGAPGRRRGGAGAWEHAMGVASEQNRGRRRHEKKK